MNKKKYDVVVPGAYFCDLVFTGLPEVPCLGKDVYARSFKMVPGGVFYPVAILHRLGLKVGWKCHFGNDLFSQFMLKAVEEEGIDPSLFEIYDQPARSLAASFSFEHERGFVSYTEMEFSYLRSNEVENIDTSCFLIPGLDYLSDLAEINKAKNREEFIVFQECQHTALNLASSGLIDALQSVDIFAPNEAEALHLTGETQVEAALERLSEIIPLVVIKCGAKGAVAQRGTEIVRVPAIKVKVVDTTGAGDSFNAGFLYAYLANLPLVTCLQYGAITGGLSTTGSGLGEIPSLKRMEKMTNDYERYC
jgi:sugar/nucleoside kinase (ribokinase family)